MNQDCYVVIEHLQGCVSEISYAMLAAAQAYTQGSGGKVHALLLGHNAQGLAKDFAADQVHYMDHPELAEFTSAAYLQALAGFFKQVQPRVVFLGHTSVGMDIASGLSARLGHPLVSQCTQIFLESGVPVFRCQICGGKMYAEGELPEPTALVTLVPGGYKPEAGRSEVSPPVAALETPDFGDLRIRLVNYIEPEVEDVDISKESLLIAVGRGLQNQDDLELVEALAEALGGTVCASRPIIDQGWLPISRLVGKSGKSVKPKVYLALGISGAPEHVEAITGSDIIIAVNTDPDAPIFNIARYGVNEDLISLVEALVEKLRHIEMV